MIRFGRLSTRLTIIFGFTVIVAVLLSVGAGYLITSNELHQEVDRLLEEQAETLSLDGLSESGRNSFVEALQDFQSNRVRAQLDAPIFIPSDIWMQISQGRDVLWFLQGPYPMPLLPSDELIALGQAPAGFTTRTFGGEQGQPELKMRVYSFQIHDGFTIQLGRNLADTDKALDDLLRRTILLGLAVMAAMAGVGWLLGRRTMKPVEQLARQADVIAQTQDLSTPIEVGRRGRVWRRRSRARVRSQARGRARARARSQERSRAHSRARARNKDEVLRLADSFNKMLAALDLSRQQQQQFVADAGHELRTPLTSLRTNIEMLADDLIEDPDEAAQMMADIQSEIVELSQIVEELIELSADPHHEEEFLPVSLAEIAGNVAGRLRGQSHLEIEVNSRNPVMLLGHERALERAVRNLVENAIKFSPGAGPVGDGRAAGDGRAGTGAAPEPIRIEIDGPQLEVLDRGAGLPEDQLEKIFGRFYRSVDAQGKPGSGLGLAITRQIIERHGGRVWARNRTDTSGRGDDARNGDDAGRGGLAVGFSLPANLPPPL